MSRHWRPLSAVCLVLGALVCWLRFSYSENDLPAISFGHKPDYSRYVPHRVLTKAELGLENPRRRLIAVGDIHGMNESFHKLLRGVRYDPKYDILITLGDMLTKSTTPGSLSLLAFLADHNVTAVRGNHDQVVVSWRAWQDSVSAFPGGELWLARLDARFAATKKGRRKWVAEERRKGEKKWWDKVPKGWVRDMMGEHYQIARAMSPTEAAYLRSLPTLVHAPSLHTFFVHAGLLASDPRLPTTAATQPLARPPPHTAPPPKRAAQEAKILTQVSQNADPWTHMHLRTITSDGELSRLLDDDDDDDDDDDGEDDGDALKNGRIFWAKVWVKTMNRCKGFDPIATSADEQEYEGEGEYAIEYTPSKQMRIDLRAKKSFNDDRSPLPCMPASVVYGHTASRGLDVRRWSVGLDSGCAYGRALSALVIDRHALKSNEDAPAEGEVELDGVRWRQIKFGDNGYASVASVSCKVEALD